MDNIYILHVVVGFQAILLCGGWKGRRTNTAYLQSSQQAARYVNTWSAFGQSLNGKHYSLAKFSFLEIRSAVIMAIWLIFPTIRSLHNIR